MEDWKLGEEGTMQPLESRHAVGASGILEMGRRELGIRWHTGNFGKRALGNTGGDL